MNETAPIAETQKRTGSFLGGNYRFTLSKLKVCFVQTLIYRL